jgi:hypothetical protein
MIHGLNLKRSSFSTAGIGDQSFIHLETDSEQYSYLNNKYLIMSVNATVPEYASLSLFQMVSVVDDVDLDVTNFRVIGRYPLNTLIPNELFPYHCNRYSHIIYFICRL